ncbi:MAG: hypothetical protein R3C26_14735 [Calditrichia bacterium]
MPPENNRQLPAGASADKILPMSSQTLITDGTAIAKPMEIIALIASPVRSADTSLGLCHLLIKRARW